MNVTPERVNTFEGPTEGFLCSVSDNKYGLDFQEFTISDYQSKNNLFKIGKGLPLPSDMSFDFSEGDQNDAARRIKYNFSEDMLRLPYIETSLKFQVGPRELKNFRMIERHYFRGELIRSYDFKFGFCIPGSVNTWDVLYEVPSLSDETINKIIDNPYAVKSDSFYFEGDKLIMHNKASYKYYRENNAQGKKSYEDKYGSKGAKSGAAKAQAKTTPYVSQFEELKIADSKDPSPRSGPPSCKSTSKDTWSKN